MASRRFGRGRRRKTKYPILHAKQDKTHPIGLSDVWPNGSAPCQGAGRAPASAGCQLHGPRPNAHFQLPRRQGRLSKQPRAACLVALRLHQQPSARPLALGERGLQRARRSSGEAVPQRRRRAGGAGRSPDCVVAGAGSVRLRRRAPVRGRRSRAARRLRPWRRVPPGLHMVHMSCSAFQMRSKCPVLLPRRRVPSAQLPDVRRPNISGMRVLLLAIKPDPTVLFRIPNRATCILLARQPKGNTSESHVGGPPLNSREPLG
jgi:hypothetical protein